MNDSIPDLTHINHDGNKPIHLAAKKGHENTVSFILSRLEEASSTINEKNAQDKYGKTALHIASENNMIEVVKVLLGANVAVDLSDNHRRTPLHLAASRGHNEVVKLLLDALACPCVPDEEMRIPLHLACAEGHKVVTDILLKRGNGTKDRLDKMGCPPLFYAVKSHHRDVSMMLKVEGAEVDSKSDGRTLLWRMAAEGNVTACEILIDLGADIEATDRKGWTPLYAAAEAGQSYAFLALIKSKANKNAVETSTGLTLLHRAARDGSIEAVQLLLEAEADKEQKDSFGRTPLYVAAKSNNHSIARELFSKGAATESPDINRSTWLHRAARDDNKAAITILLDLGANKEARDTSNSTPLYVAAKGNKMQAARALADNIDINASDSLLTGETLLHRAAREGNISATDILIALGANVDARDKQGRTPLHEVVATNARRAVYSLSVKANHNVKDNNGQTPLHIACGRGKEATEIVQLLIEYGAEVNTTDNNGHTPLHIACDRGKEATEIVRLLIEAGAKVDTQDNNGHTPMHDAAARGELEVLLILVENTSMRERLNETDKNEKTALHFAAEYDMVDALQLLIIEGLDIEAKDKKQQTPLHLAAQHGKTAAARKLIAMGANRKAVDAIGYFPLHHASEGGFNDTLKLLLDMQPIVDTVPETKEQYIIFIHKFVRKTLREAIRPPGQRVKELAIKAATNVSIITERWKLNPDSGPNLVKLMLYDFVILCDDSTSMHLGKRVENLKLTLNRVAQIAQSMDLDQSGINIRFLNYTKDSSGDFDNMTDLQAISQRVSDVFREKRKGSELGGKLKEKIIDPFVEKRIQNHEFKKPIIVVLITDGEPHERKGALKQVIKDCKGLLVEKGYGNSSVIFLLSQVGTNKSATQFLKGIEQDEDISHMVYCSPSRLDDMIHKTQEHGSDDEYTAKLAEMFLAALEKQAALADTAVRSDTAESDKEA